MKRAVWEHPRGDKALFGTPCQKCGALFRYALYEGLCNSCRKLARIKPTKIPPDGGYISLDTPGYVYVMIPELMGELLPAIKIGFTRNIETRRAHLQKGACYRMLVHASMRGTLRDETRIRTRLTPWRIQGKTDWFQRLPHRPCNIG